jgi:hypothetical protein
MVVLARAAVLVALLLAPLALATTLLVQGVPSLTREADVIVRATVVSSQARWTDDGARIMTDTTLRVTERWKGTTEGTIVVMQPGGEVGDVGQLVHGVARFRPGEDVVVFLVSRGSRYLVSGMLQGKFLVEKSSDGRATFARQEFEGEALFIDPVTRQPVRPVPTVMMLDELRARVLAAAGATAPPEAPKGPGRVTP